MKSHWDAAIHHGVDNLMSCYPWNAKEAKRPPPPPLSTLPSLSHTNTRTRAHTHTWTGTDKQPHLHVLTGLDKFAHQTFQLTGPLDETAEVGIQGLLQNKIEKEYFITHGSPHSHHPPPPHPNTHTRTPKTSHCKQLNKSQRRVRWMGT